MSRPESRYRHHFLGAHALPEEYKGRSDAYIDFLINEMLPMIHQKQLAENCDIFCEKEYSLWNSLESY